MQVQLTRGAQQIISLFKGRIKKLKKMVKSKSHHHQVDLCSRFIVPRNHLFGRVGVKHGRRYTSWRRRNKNSSKSHPNNAGNVWGRSAGETSSLLSSPRCRRACNKKQRFRVLQRVFHFLFFSSGDRNSEANDMCELTVIKTGWTVKDWMSGTGSNLGFPVSSAAGALNKSFHLSSFNSAFPSVQKHLWEQPKEKELYYFPGIKSSQDSFQT